MKVLRTIGLGILYFMGSIILAVVAVIVGLAIFLGYFYLQSLMFCRGDYLLFVAGDLNMIPVIMIMLLIIFVFFRIIERFIDKKNKKEEIIYEKDEPLDIEGLNKFQKFLLKLMNAFLERDKRILKAFRILKISYILVLIVAIYLGMTSYTILYTEIIKVGSPIAPSGVVYKYSDIKNVDVSVSSGSKKSYSPHYKVIFNDGKSADLFGGSMQDSKGERFEYILIDLDEKLRTQGVVKTVDKENFSKYAEGLDRDFISRVEKLFDDK